MVRHQSVSFTPTLRTFISKVITPAVLVGGVLFLIIFNFRGVLQTVQTGDDRFQSLVSFNQGPLAYRFSETSGTDRPTVSINNQDLITYPEWSSFIAVDGNVQELWNSGHGYSYDETKRQMFNTVNGPAWQFIEVVTLVDDRTVTVTFQFAARPGSMPTPVHYVFDIAHAHTWWYQYQLSNNNTTFTAQYDQTADSTKAAKLSVKIAGVDTTQAPQLKLSGYKSTASASGTTTMAGGLISEYVVDNPTPDKVITLGTETITYDPGAADPNAASNSIVPLPNP